MPLRIAPRSGVAWDTGERKLRLPVSGTHRPHEVFLRDSRIRSGVVRPTRVIRAGDAGAARGESSGVKPREPGGRTLGHPVRKTKRRLGVADGLGLAPDRRFHVLPVGDDHGRVLRLHEVHHVESTTLKDGFTVIVDVVSINEAGADLAHDEGVADRSAVILVQANGPSGMVVVDLSLEFPIEATREDFFVRLVKLTDADVIRQVCLEVNEGPRLISLFCVSRTRSSNLVCIK